MDRADNYSGLRGIPGQSEKTRGKGKEAGKETGRSQRHAENYQRSDRQKLQGKTEDAQELMGTPYIKCAVPDADDEWLKLTYADGKNSGKTKILRIDSIDNIELIDE